MRWTYVGDVSDWELLLARAIFRFDLEDWLRQLK